MPALRHADTVWGTCHASALHPASNWHQDLPLSTLLQCSVCGFCLRYKVIDYGLADFEARYAAGMIGDAAEHGTQSAPKEETHRQRKQREREAERDPSSSAKRTLALRKNVIPSVSAYWHQPPIQARCLRLQDHFLFPTIECRKSVSLSFVDHS